MFANEYSFLEGCLNDVEVKLKQKQKEADSEEQKRNKELEEQERSKEQATQKHDTWHAERQARLRKANAELLIKRNEDMKEAKEHRLEQCYSRNKKQNKNVRKRKIGTKNGVRYIISFVAA